MHQQESGLAAWIGGHLQPLAEVPPAAAVILITAFLACFTEFASNTATIIIFLPVIAELVRMTLNTNKCCMWMKRLSHYNVHICCTSVVTDGFISTKTDGNTCSNNQFSDQCFHSNMMMGKHQNDSAPRQSRAVNYEPCSV